VVACVVVLLLFGVTFVTLSVGVGSYAFPIGWLQLLQYFSLSPVSSPVVVRIGSPQHFDFLVLVLIWFFSSQYIIVLGSI